RAMSAVPPEPPRASAESTEPASDRAETKGPPTPASADFGQNEWLVDELYQRYLADPGSVDMAWWSFFAGSHPPAGGPGAPGAEGTGAAEAGSPGTDGAQGPGGPGPHSPGATAAQAPSGPAAQSAGATAAQAPGGPDAHTAGAPSAQAPGGPDAHSAGATADAQGPRWPDAPGPDSGAGTPAAAGQARRRRHRGPARP